MAKRIRDTSTWLPLAGLVVLVCLETFYFFGPNLFGAFSLIDDHEIFRFTQGEGQLSFTSIPQILLSETEVGDWPNSPRFRPIHFLFKLIETSTFGLVPFYWFLWRLAIATFLSFSLGAITFLLLKKLFFGRLRLIFSFSVGLLVSTATLLLPTWTGILLRLGPSEIYVALGLGMMFWGLFIKFITPKYSFGFLLIFIGSAIAIGSKEDMIILAGFVSLLFFQDWKQLNRTYVLVVAYFLFICFSFYVAIGFGIGTIKNGGDVYGQTRSIGKFLTLLPNNQLLFLGVLGCVFAFIALSSSVAQTKIVALGSKKLKYITVILMPLFFIITEAYFYQNTYSDVTGGIAGLARYGLVSQIMTVLSLMYIAISLFFITEAVFIQQVLSLIAITSIFLVSWFGGVLNIAFSTYRSISIEASLISTNNNNQVIEVSESTRSSGFPVQIIVQHPYDYENIFGIAQQLRTYSNTKSVSLFFAISSGDEQDPYLKNLLVELEEKSLWGDMDNGWRIAKTNSYSKNQIFTCVSFIKPPNQTPSNCNELLVVE